MFLEATQLPLRLLGHVGLRLGLCRVDAHVFLLAEVSDLIPLALRATRTVWANGFQAERRSCESKCRTRRIKSLRRIRMVPFWLPLAAIHADAGRIAYVRQPT